MRPFEVKSGSLTLLERNRRIEVDLLGMGRHGGRSTRRNRGVDKRQRRIRRIREGWAAVRRAMVMSRFEKGCNGRRKNDGMQ
jgi:hypothetical protein